ncbi:MAG: ABC transporter substrate-binding protein [Victivallaceae bacterium]
MKKSFFLYKVLSLVLVLVLILLYWSSDLVERDVKSLKIGVDGLRDDVKELLNVVSKNHIKENYSDLKIANLRKPESTVICGDPVYPNILSEDPYLENTLPNLLSNDLQPSGTLRLACVGRPDNLNPFNGFHRVVAFYDQCVPGLAALHVGKFEEFAPELALKIEEHSTNDGSGEKEFRIFLRKDIYWQPLNPDFFPKSFVLDDVFQKPHPLTAHDFKFFYDVVMNPYISEMQAVSLRSDFEDIVDFSVIDDHAFIVRWKSHVTINDEGEEENKVQYGAFKKTLYIRPLPRFVYQYFSDGNKIVEDDRDPLTYQNNSLWAQNFTTHWAGNYIISVGPYIFNGFDDHCISFIRNPNHYQPLKCLVEKVTVMLKDSCDAIFNDFKTGKLDLCFLTPNHREGFKEFMRSAAYRTQVEQGAAVKEIVSADNGYCYIGWNLQTVFFESTKVRQALNMLIDKDRIIEQIFNGYAYAITGPFSLFSPSYNSDIEDWCFSPEEAERLLEDEGWIDTDGDGIREKEIEGVRVPFKFNLCYFVQSGSSKALVEQISMSLRSAGIDCRILGLSMADLSKKFEDKSFDALSMGWCMGPPPEDPRALWHSEGAYLKGSANMVGFSCPEVDALIDRLTYEYDRTKRKQIYYRLHEKIHEESPYTFLCSRKTTIVYRDYVKNIFVPKIRKDLIPGAEDQEINYTILWIDRRE